MTNLWSDNACIGRSLQMKLYVFSGYLALVFECNFAKKTFSYVTDIARKSDSPRLPKILCWPQRK